MGTTSTIMPRCHQLILDPGREYLAANKKAILALFGPDEPALNLLQLSLLISESLATNLDEESITPVAPKYLFTCCNTAVYMESVDAHSCQTLTNLLEFVSLPLQQFYGFGPRNYASACEAINYLVKWLKTIETEAEHEGTHDPCFEPVCMLLQHLLRQVELYARIGQIPYFHYRAIYRGCRQCVSEGPDIGLGALMSMHETLAVAEARHKQRLEEKIAEHTRVFEEIRRNSDILPDAPMTFDIDVGKPVELLHKQLWKWYGYIDQVMPGAPTGVDIISHGIFTCIMLHEMVKREQNDAYCLSCLKRVGRWEHHHSMVDDWEKHRCMPWALARVTFRNGNKHVDVYDLLQVFEKYRHMWLFRCMWSVLSDYVMNVARRTKRMSAETVQELYNSGLLHGDSIDEGNLLEILMRAPRGTGIYASVVQ